MFWTRLISGIVLIALAIFFVGYGGPLLWAVSLLISLIGQMELYRVLKIDKHGLGVVGYLTTIIYYLMILRGHDQLDMLLFVSALMIDMALYVFRFPRYKTEQVSVAFFGIFYVGVMFSYLYKTRTMPYGQYFAWLIFLSSWGSDTCAYAVGMLIGKHKIAPVLSPKKSIEGCIGGVIGAGILGYIFGAVFSGQMTDTIGVASTCAISCSIGAVISQIGDFAASAIKRNHDIKDYGHLIPGHGGILDRFDSMLFTAPAIYYALFFLLRFAS